MKFSTSRRVFEITFEKSETLKVRQTSRTTHAWCDSCGREVEMTAPESAADIAGISRRSVYARIEDGGAHFVESGDGTLMVCLSSLRPRQISEKGESEEQ